MLKVALTGGIATGKSHVLAECRRLGVPCLDADELSHGVTTAGTEATAAIAARFGHHILDAEGAVDRKALGPIVFADETARHDLEQIVHPAVYRAIAAGLRGFELIGGAPIAIVAIPLLFETGHAGDFDKVVATVCDPLQQLSRLRARGLTEAGAQARMAAQMSAAEKAARADFVIQTNGSIEDTDEQVAELLRRLVGPPLV